MNGFMISPIGIVIRYTDNRGGATDSCRPFTVNPKNRPFFRLTIALFKLVRVGG